MLRRFSLTMLLLASALVTACQSATPAQVQQPTAAAPTAAPTPSAAASTRTITDASGATVAVPSSPQRVVTLSEQDLDGALAVGLTPVGSVNGRGQNTLPLYLSGRVQGIESVGSLSEPSAEKIAALKPDLILFGGLTPAIEKTLPQLRAIAPVVITYNNSDDWKTAFKRTAAALNRDAEASAFLSSYDAKVAEVKAAVLKGGSAEVSIVRWNPTGPGIMQREAFASLVLSDLGMVRPAGQQTPGFSHSEPLSIEQLGQIDADWLFLGTLNADGAAALEQARKNPLWQQLSVVKNQHVVEVDGTIWTSRGGPLAALIVLDTVKSAMAGVS